MYDIHIYLQWNWYDINPLLITWLKHGYVIAPIIKCGMKLLILSQTPLVGTAHPKNYAFYDDDVDDDDGDDDDDDHDDDDDDDNHHHHHDHDDDHDHDHGENQSQVISCSLVLINNAMACFSLAVIYIYGVGSLNRSINRPFGSTLFPQAKDVSHGGVFISEKKCCWVTKTLFVNLSIRYSHLFYKI